MTRKLHYSLLCAVALSALSGLTPVKTAKAAEKTSAPMAFETVSKLYGKKKERPGFETGGVRISVAEDEPLALDVEDDWRIKMDFNNALADEDRPLSMRDRVPGLDALGNESYALGIAIHHKF